MTPEFSPNDLAQLRLMQQSQVRSGIPPNCRMHPVTVIFERDKAIVNVDDYFALIKSNDQLAAQIELESSDEGPMDDATRVILAGLFWGVIILFAIYRWVSA